MSDETVLDTMQEVVSEIHQLVDRERVLAEEIERVFRLYTAVRRDARDLRHALSLARHGTRRDGEPCWCHEQYWYQGDGDEQKGQCESADRPGKDPDCATIRAVWERTRKKEA